MLHHYELDCFHPLGALKTMASIGVLGLLLCVINSASKEFPSKPSMILTHRRDMQSRCSQKCDFSRKFHEARQQENNPPGEVISPTLTQTERRALVRGTEFITNAATIQGDSVKFVVRVSVVLLGRSPGNCFPQLGPQPFVITGEAATSRSRSSPILMEW
jgi:hypothetical protein